LSVGGFGAPAASIDSVTIGRVHGDSTPFGQLALSNLAVPNLFNPTAQAHIDQLLIQNIKASTSIGKIELHNVVAPFELLNLTLAQVGIDTLSVPSVASA
jgi:hypothetical protein